MDAGWISIADDYTVLVHEESAGVRTSACSLIFCV
jgi:hypothetical protein